MPGFKEFLESLQKMTDVRLNIAILATCLALIFISPADHFILDPLPKIIPQSLILITSIRIVFSIINSFHSFLTTKMEAKELQKKEILEKQKKLANQQHLKKQIEKDLQELDVFQLHIIKNLIGKNHSSHNKNAALFSLTNKNITYVVATGDSSQSVTLTGLAKGILEDQYNNDLSELEKNAAARAFNSMSKKELSLFNSLLDNESIKTTWVNRERRTEYAPSHETFNNLKQSIIFEQPQKGFTYSLNPILNETLSNSLQIKIADNT